MKVRRFICGLLLLAFGPAALGQHATSLTNRFSGRSFPNEPGDLWHVWLSTATVTNAWAVSLRNQEGWSRVVEASFKETLSQAEQGSAAAQVKLGYCYFAGEGVQPDYEQGVKWLMKAQEVAPAQFLLGAATLRGLGVPQDFSAGVDWLDKAAVQGFAEAQFQLGLCYLEGGPGVNEAPARGAKWLERAAEQGHPRAQQCLGECYSFGIGVNPEDAQAAKWYRQAADQELAPAQDYLGVCYATGTGVDKAPAEALKWFQKAAEQGLGVAQCNLARCYEGGAGVGKDLSEAARWWRRAADQGFPGAAFHLGLCYYRGKGVGESFEEAARWFQKDAELGHVGGQLYLGLCCWTGDGVPKDSSQAAKWWREAGIQGIQPKWYVGFDGSVGDAAEIESWWRDVAKRGNAKLQACVAEFYHYGRGVTQDEAEALRWYRRAANAGDRVGLKAAAWLMATSDDPKVRDGSAAVSFAEKVDDATKHKDPLILDTLAAAYAEAGQFEKAVTTEKSAIAVSKTDSQRNEFQARLRLYETNTPFRASRPPVGGF
ncbi:MAG TPA: hypothetical protein VNZ64_10820 [Candidatus Acidoferrum sp.]|nr:hypothetical protein [Candidatus Acidoferrum sp.]